MKRILISCVFSLLAVQICLGGVLDQVVFGDGSSESFHNVVATIAAVQTGALAQNCRRISSAGSITFTLACDPVEQNYLTVKLWGGDTVIGTQYLYLYDPTNQIGTYQDDWPEVAIWTSQAPFPSRFVYSTYLIPQHLTNGNTQVTLKLSDAELAIYRVYTHLEPFFDPGDEIQGINPGPGPVRPTGTRSQYDQLVYQANLGIAEFLTWQKYGPAWDAQVAAGTAPAVITGAVTFNGSGGNSSWTIQQWKEDIYARFTSSNMVCLQALEAYGIAYNSPWSSYYHNAELVDRIVKGLDFFRVAQGANGAFSNPWGLMWIGGPGRVKGAGCLEGFGAHSLPDAFLQVHDQISTVILNELVDDDDDAATPAVTRKTSYINLFKGIISHMLTDRGHAPNQDRAQVHAMYQSNKCLKILSPADAWSDSAALQWVYEAMGAAPCPIYDGFWESVKGLALEVHGTINGGYCGNYGAAALSFAHIYGDMTGKSNVIVNNIINNEVDSFANYLYVDNDSRGYKGLVNESVISWRPNKYPAVQFPSTGGFNGLAYAALELNNQNAIRILQHFIDNRKIYTIDCSASAVAAHYEDNTLGAIRMVDIFQQVQALATTSTRLPMEKNAIVAWADEQAAGVVLQHQGARMYMTMNWRHEYCSGCDRSEANAVVNNIARIHYTTDTVDRIVNASMESPYGKFKLYTCRFGDYLIAVNMSETESFALDVSGLEGDFAADIVGNVKVDIQTNPVVPPRTTMVLYPGECAEFLTTDINKDCYVDLADFEIFAIQWLKQAAF
ncbi:MAG: hypothetical protein JW860_03115 [Sedimentisphaerales bacterium]|nr:hypothetical protein [Sedimentisphaerales bacterium]